MWKLYPISFSIRNLCGNYILFHFLYETKSQKRLLQIQNVTDFLHFHKFFDVRKKNPQIYSKVIFTDKPHSDC